MKRRKWVLGSLALIVVSGVWSGVALATSRVVNARDVRTIENGEGEARWLLDFGSLNDLEGVLITGAFIDVDLPGEIPNEDIDVAVYTLDTRWSDGATTWTSPWENPGGDVNGTCSRSVTMFAGDRAPRLRINVTQAVRSMLRGEQPANGFLLSVPVQSGDGFRSPERTVLGTLSGAKLDIQYVRVARRARVGR